MFIYSRTDRSLYANLTSFRQGWLDYWLYLHGDESSACLAARPISPWFLANAIRGASAGVDNALLNAAQSIARRLIISSQKTLPSAPVMRIVRKQGQSFVVEPIWRRWAESVISTPQLSYREDLLQLLRAAEASNDFRLAAFASRRLAAELAANDWSAKALFGKARFSLLQLDQAPDAVLREVFDQSKAQQEFVVELDFAHVFAPGAVAKRRLSTGMALITSKRPEELPHIPSHRIEGLRCTVTADEMNQAVVKAVDLAANVIHDFRIRDYVRTHLTGTARVLTAEGGTSWFSLPQPFWTPGPGRKEVPRLPARTLAENDPTWAAGLEHLAIALALWVESPHGAASGVWQALESVGLRHPALMKQVEEVARLIADRELSYAARKFNAFRLAMVPYRNVEDWYFWSDKYPATKWAGRIFDSRSPNNAGTWKDAPPLAWFDLSDGVLANLWRASAGLSTWFVARLHEDLSLLYAVRNAFVHKGSRFGNRRFAEHVARVGLECFVSLAVQRALFLQRSRAADAAQQGATADGAARRG